MSTDIRLNISWYTSLKRKSLIRRLGHRGVTAIIDLWLYTAQHKPDGNLAGLSDDDIAEAAQYDGDSKEFLQAIGPKPDGLGFLDGNSNGYKVHEWKEHNPWAYHSKARSKAAKKAVEERWRKERAIRDEYEAHTDGIQGVEEPHIPLSSSSSNSLPSPPKNKKPPAGDNEYVKVWIDLYREIKNAPKYNPTGREIAELKRIWGHLKASMPDFKLISTNYLSSKFVHNPSALKLYQSGIECYRQPQVTERKPRSHSVG